MQKTLKVNVAFQMEVPIRTDSAGRRLSITDQVSPYITDFFSDLHTEMKVLKHHNYGPCKRCETFNYDAQEDLDLFEKVAKCDTFDYVTPSQTDESRIRWEKQKDFECWQFFKMSWKEFKTLSWTEQAKVREANGVIWENNAWVKKA